ncbi:hypothetical protein GCM10022225_17700 [Plantactinospora mayteni]|uniref:Bacterial bifunctional deaminase-reductase C-terminal domain-containing protein n=1 Tax=Plantactinospora mayteni TaxID=566021 RepID=A0ABQ4EGR5_9ACTN|nr:dihydrofolate reductase family protein [Plantactinospora mayteni]GIG93844.1 hypothetical protein Pma05_04170 [Plantactinospora mayteni]
MKTILYASLTANGHVVRSGPDHEIPPEVLTDFIGQVRQHRNLVVGRRTFDLVSAGGGGGGGAFAGVEVVVLSRHAPAPRGGYVVVASPADALRHLADRGHHTALLGGGATTNNAFLAEDLVDECYLNVAPALTGNGGGMALPAGRHAALHLLDVRRLGGDIVQLHHRVAR